MSKSATNTTLSSSSFLKHKLIFVGLLVILSILTLIAYLFLSDSPISLNRQNNNTNSFVYTANDGSTINISISSKFSNYYIDQNSINKAFFEQLMQRHGFADSPQFKLIYSDRQVTPKNINFRYVDKIKHQELQNYYPYYTKDKNGNQIFIRSKSAQYDVETNTLNYFIIFSSNTFDSRYGSRALNELSTTWAMILHELLFVVSKNYHPNSVNAELVKEIHTMENQFGGSLFRVEQDSSFSVKNLTSQVQDVLIPRVYAQCTNKYACDKVSYVYECPDGSSCNGPDDFINCSTPGTCSRQEECGNAGYDQFDCSGATQTQCFNSPDCSDDAYCGITYAQCDWESSSGGCPDGTYYCGDCIDSCIDNSQSCTERINNECGSEPPPDPDEWYGCSVSNECAGAYGSEAECEENASSCQKGSCPSCGSYYSCDPFCTSWGSDSTCGGDTEDCVSGGCPSDCPINRSGGEYFWLYDDINDNGSWDYPGGGELRITPLDSCDFGNVYTAADQTAAGLAPGDIQLYFDDDGNIPYNNTDEISARCGVGNDEPCANSPTCFNTDCSWGAEACEVNDAGDTGDADYCSGDTNIKSDGPIYELSEDKGWYWLEIELPDGWSVSSGTIDYWLSDDSNAKNDPEFRYVSTTTEGRTRVQFYVYAHSINTYACSQFTGIGFSRDYQKSASVTAADTSVSVGDTVSVSGSGYSEAPRAEPSRMGLVKIDPNDPNATETISPAPENTTYVTANGLDYYIYNSGVQVPNWSFESGTTAGWSASSSIGEFWTPEESTYPNTSYEGTYGLSINRADSGDAYVASDWMSVGSVANQTFNLEFALRSHNASNTITNIGLQTSSFGPGSYQSFGSVDITTSWQLFNREITFPGTNNDTNMRVILRVPEGDSNTKVYYDAIKVGRENTGYNCSTGYGNYCGDRVDIDTLPQGTYKFFADVPTTTSEYPQRCSGNPHCAMNGGHLACDGWNDCGPNDNVEIDVSCTNQCGGGCGTADLGNPTTNITSPPAGDNDMTGSPNSLSITWNDSSGLAENWDVKILNSNAYTINQTGISDASCNNTNVLCIDERTTTSYSYNPNTSSYAGSTGPADGDDIGDQITVAVRGRNTTCGDEVGSWDFHNVDLVGDVPTQALVIESGESCQVSEGDPANFGGDQQDYTAISSNYPDQQQSSSNYDYTMDNLRYIGSNWSDRYQLRLDLSSSDPDSTYVCAECSEAGGPTNCSPAPNDARTAPISNPANNPANFYLLNYNLSNGPWFQWSNGLAFSGNSYTSAISNICQTASCKPYMAMTHTGDNLQAGIPIGGNDISNGSGDYSERDEGAGQPGEFAKYQDFSGVTRRDYDYYTTVINFESLDSYSNNQISNFTNQFENYGGFGDEEGAQVFYRNGNLTLDATSADGYWDIAQDDSYLVFVDGNLTIQGDPGEQIINVDQGGFLAFIVSGTITFENSVGHSVSETNPPENLTDLEDANVEGVFVANNIVVASDGDGDTIDNKFIGSGSFTGWDSISLERTYDDNLVGASLHNESPTELFFYRPDFVTNTPRVMQETSLLWQQTN